MPEFHYHLPDKPTSKQKAERDVAYAKWAAEERQRIARQRLYLSVLRSGPFKDAMVKAMCDRAWTLLDMGECEAADALLEFVPEPVADALLNEFFPD